MSARNLAALGLALGLTVGTSGCLIVPTPEYDTGKARANINKKTPQRFEPGQTTRAEVMTALGEPDAVTPEESKLAYRSEKVCGLWFVGGYGSAAGGSITKDRYFVAEFDEHGVLRKAERSSTWFGSKYAGKVLNTSTNAAAAGFHNAAMSDEHPALTVCASWHAGVDGFKGKGREIWVGETGRLLIYSTRLEFLSDARFANTGPAFTLPFDSLTEACVDKYFLGRRLVVHTRAGETHSFDIYGPKGRAQNRAALEQALGLLQAGIGRGQPTSATGGQSQSRP
ncbi:MAG: hypothetical protein MUF81_00940 [Verrucomicrobia bacterium]|jgi:hypothetical protein|nr:hypothetical protein [Verrucomicrobiota bacterium]